MGFNTISNNTLAREDILIEHVTVQIDVVEVLSQAPEQI